MADDSTQTLAEQEDEFAHMMEVAGTIVRRYWLRLLLSTVAGAALAYCVAGRKEYQYSRSTSIILKEEKSGFETSSDKLLETLGMESSSANIANESFVLKSSALMQKTVEELGLNVSYWAPKRFRMVDMYQDSPFTVEFNGIEESCACELTVTMTDGEHYTLSYVLLPSDEQNRVEEPELNKEPVEVPGTHTFGESLSLPFAQVTVQPTSFMNPECVGIAYEVRRQSVAAQVRDLLEHLKVSRSKEEKNASLLELTLVGSHPQRVTDILNKLVEVYNQSTQEIRGESARKTEDFIHRRLEEIGNALNEIDTQIAARKAADAVTTAAEVVITADFTTAETLKREIFELETEQKLMAVLAENLENARNSGGLIALDFSLDDTGITDEIKGYNEAYLEYQRLSTSAGARNPALVVLADKMDSTLVATKRALENYRHSRELKLKELQNKQSEIEQSLVKTAEHEQQLSPLLREHKVKEELYLLLLAKEQENAFALALATPSAIVLETAHGEPRHISPNMKLYVALGAAGGATLSFLLIYAFLLLDNKVKTRTQIVEYSSYPVVAELPKMNRQERREVQKSHIITAEFSQMVEGLHILRNNAESLVPRVPGRATTYLMSSTQPGEGKTFVSANLAAAFAQVGRRVLLMDCDLRKRSLSQATGGKGRKGLSSILLNKLNKVTDAIHPLPKAPKGVSIIYAGPPVPNPVTLLTQKKVEELMEAARASYDIIILDAPPFGLLADAALLAKHCDASLYVVRSGMIHKQIISQVDKLAKEAKLPQLGYVINAVDFKSVGRGSYGYGYGYGYGNRYFSKAEAEKEISDAEAEVFPQHN